MAEEAATAYADNLLAMQRDMEEDGLSAIFVWNTPGGSFLASETIKAAYKSLEDAHIPVWTVADKEALSAAPISWPLVRRDAASPCQEPNSAFTALILARILGRWFGKVGTP